MNRHAILHIIDSSYCFPVSENEIVLRLRTAKNDIEYAEVVYENKYDFGISQNTQEMSKLYTSELYDYFVVKLTLNDPRLAYVFRVFDGEQYYYFSEDGITVDYDFTLGFYNFFQYPYINKADIMKKVEWMKEAVFYQIFVDRFNMAQNDKNKDYINTKWGEIPTAKSFCGGDLRGITQKLNYIKSLGCNTIYLTPIFESISNHKYDISDYYKVDRQFGDEADLHNLIDNAHAKNMRVVLDAVFNHCSDRLKEFEDVIQKGRASKYFDWFIIDGDGINEARDNYQMFGPCEYMPKLNTSNPEVQKYLIDIGCYYVNEFHIDGWRLDVSDEVSHDFWRNFRKAIKNANEDVILIGENWHDAYSNLRGDQYDGIMNYSFTKACLDYFAKDKFNEEQLAWRLNDVLMRNSDTVNSMMLNLLDSHDTHRFFSEVGEDRNKFEAALCLLYMFPGAPCIYYGTEIMMPGGYDPDCRRCMDWSKAESDLCALPKKLAKIRREYKLSEGLVKIYAEAGEFVLENTLESNVVVLRIKKGNYEITLNGGKLL